MIQRVQSVFLVISSISLLLILYNFPILKDINTDISYFLKNTYPVIRFLVFIASALSLFSVFLFKDRKKQLLIVGGARLIITVIVVLILFVYKEDYLTVDIGMLLLIVPFLALILASYFIKKDERLVKSADRIR